MISASRGPTKEAADFSGTRVAGKHLVVAVAEEVAVVRIVAVGTDPEQPVIVKHNSVGRIEHVPLIDVVGSGIGDVMNCRVAGEGKMTPGKLVGSKVPALGLPPQDLAVDVGTRGLGPPPEFGSPTAFVLMPRL